MTGGGKISVRTTCGTADGIGTGNGIAFFLSNGMAALTGKMSGAFFNFLRIFAPLANLTTFSALMAFAPATFSAIVFLATRIGAVMRLSAATFDAFI